MGKSMQLDVVTPDRVVISEKVEYVSAPGIMGEFGVLPGHVPMLAALAVGPLSFVVNGKRESAFVGGGFAEVSDDKITILAESSELAKDIDAARAEEAKRRAEKRLDNRKDEMNTERAHLALKRAIIRLELANMR